MNLYRKTFWTSALAAALCLTPFALPLSVAKEEVAANRIVEIATFSDLLKYARPKSLVLIDIDDTLMEPEQTMGTDRWFIWRKEYYVNKGDDPKLALEKALMDWVAVQCLTKVKLTEPGTDAQVRRLQDSGVVAMGLTTRGGSLATRTVQQLESLGIDLSLAAPSREEKVFLNPHEVIYKNGILFTSGTNKEQALFKFLEMVKDQYPHERFEEIVFINDKMSHLADVQAGCIEKGVPFIGLRYGFADERIRNFSEEIAELQFKHFGKIMSDKEAVDVLKKQCPASDET